MEKKSSLKPRLIVFLATLLFIVIPLTFFFISLKYPPKPQKIIISFPTPTPNPTQKWQVFVNKSYHYQIKYPKKWAVKFLPSPESKTILDAEYFNDGPTVDYVQNRMSLVITNEPIEKATKLLNYEEKLTGFRTIAETKIETVQGKKIIKALITTAQLDPETKTYMETGKSYQIFIPLGQNTLTLHAKITDKDLANQMLTTFQFLEK